MDELKRYYADNVQDGALILQQSNGTDVRWIGTEKHTITYCVSTAFASNYDAVVNAMIAAADAWEAVANVNFTHMVDQDSFCTNANNNVIFDVSPIGGQPYLARAFFPNFVRAIRNVLIDASSFGTIAPWTLTGILRHELGHTLGFRHEHTRPESGTCLENNTWRPLTTYDAASVMHYPQCNGTQVGDLVLTQLDGVGAVTLYGSPPNFWTPAFSDATGWSVSQAYWGTISYPDLNGDGKQDVCGRVDDGLMCALSNGASFGSVLLWTATYSDGMVGIASLLEHHFISRPQW
jgi:hypothetical protein